MSEASREENGERGGEENACQQTGTNRGLFFKYAASGGGEFLLAKSLISLFEVNKLCKIIPSVALLSTIVIHWKHRLAKGKNIKLTI